MLSTEAFLRLFQLAGFGVLLLAISTLFSFSKLCLQPFFDKFERGLHRLPAEQYLTVFAWPVVQVSVFAVVMGLGVNWLGDEGLMPILGGLTLAVGTAAAIWTGLSAAGQLADRSDPVDCTSPHKPALMRLAVATLHRAAKALRAADVSRGNVHRLRTEHERLSAAATKLLAQLDQPSDAAEKRVSWAFRRQPLYTWFVTIGSATVLLLAVAALVLAVIDEKSLLRAGTLTGSLAVVTGVLWWTGIVLRAKSTDRQYNSLSGPLQEELGQIKENLAATGAILSHQSQEDEELLALAKRTLTETSRIREEIAGQHSAHAAERHTAVIREALLEALREYSQHSLGRAATHGLRHPDPHTDQ